MKSILFAVLLCGATTSQLVASVDSLAAPQYDKAEMRKMIRSAHSTDQYRVLAAYFRDQQQHFEQQAQAEKQEWQRRSENVSGPAAKYPRPVDSSKNRYEYFAYEAQQMNRKAAHFEGLIGDAH